MAKPRLFPYLLFLAGFAGMAGLAGWNFWQIRQAATDNQNRWVSRMAEMIVSERQSINRWVDQFPPSENLMSVLARSSPFVDAIFLVDHEKHQTTRWLRPSVGQKIDQLDPRLVALELKAAESNRTEMGPVILLDGIAHGTVIRPIDSQHVLIAFVRAEGISRVLAEESQLWHLHTFVYDYEQHPIFVSGSLETVRDAIPSIVTRVRAGTPSGRVPLPRSQRWQWVATFHYDPASDWIFIVGQPAYWVYAPLIPFILSVLGIWILARAPRKAARDIDRQHTAYLLKQFAQRVERFISGKDPSLAEPPYPHSELIPIVTGLRYYMPLWKKAEAFPRELALERKLLELLVESLPEGILFFNAQGGLQLSNELGRAFLAHQQESGRESKMVSGVQVPRGFLEPFAEPVFTGQQKNLGKEVDLKWADGKHLYRVWVEAVEASENTTDGFIIVVRDITFRRQWEYVQEQVLSGITHDLRGPLSAVMGYLDLMRRQVKEDQLPKVAEYIKLAREAGNRLTQMISDILDVVRFEQGKIELQPTAIPVQDIFKRLDNLFSVTAAQKQVTIKFAKEGVESDTTTWGDPKLIERVFDNLVGNAIKFTPSGGTITVVARRSPGRLVFEVGDTGRGIPKEAQSRIFDKFQQVRPGDRSGGYGLGLAVVKFIVEAHKGEIRVESEVGQGSRFTFWVPDQADAPSAAAASASA